MKNLFVALFLALFFGACSAEKAAIVTINNNSTQIRNNEMVEVSYDSVASLLALPAGQSILVEGPNGKQVPYQIVYEGNKEPQKIIFLTTLGAKGSATYKIKQGTPEPMKCKAYGRIVKERKDDICWENDRIAFRTYGPALEATGEITNAYDIWVKRTEDTIINKRYHKELVDKISYHKDNGDGMDNYTAGRTLGAGAMAPYFNDTIVLAKNWITCEILDNGPLRISFRMTYAPFKVGENMVEETRFISLDAGSQLNKVIDTYKNLPEGALVAAGIVKHQGMDEFMAESNGGYACYADPIVNAEDGQTFIATVFPQAVKEIKAEACGHCLTITNDKGAAGNIYYFGAGWTKWGFADSATWYDYVKSFSEKLRSPLVVSITK